MLRLALAQLNATVGDIAGNEAKIAAAIAAAQAQGAQLVVVPELALIGYPPEDLLLREHVLRDTRAALDRLAGEVSGIVAVVGFPERADDVYNAAAVLADGAVRAIYRKSHLPNYGVFDEHRYFRRGTRGATIDVDGARVGLTICEDVWLPGPPESDEARAGATLIVNLSASPFQAGKAASRERMIAQRARDESAAFAYCALVGGQDELVFDGGSFVCDHEGTVLARAAQFREELLVVDIDVDEPAKARLRDTRHRTPAADDPREVDHGGAYITPAGAPATPRTATVATPLAPGDEVYEALVLGTRDYAAKNGFQHAVLGLSGGVDSALVAVVAVDALGADRVTCVTMPSQYSSAGTRGDAAALAASLGTALLELPIAAVAAAYDAVLSEPFAGLKPDLTEENLQARIRGNYLMALSNKLRWLVLTTGNKSEMSVGYSTLYGDSAGGFAVIKDVPKLLVYRLARLRNARGEVPLIPETILTRAPSAELRPDQRDDDSLPPYEVLDPILEGYVEDDLGIDELVARGFDRDVVTRVVRLVDLAEYKRRQQPPGIKVTSKAFGRDRRMPITNRYRDEG